MTNQDWTYKELLEDMFVIRDSTPRVLGSTSREEEARIICLAHNSSLKELREENEQNLATVRELRRLDNEEMSALIRSLREEIERLGLALKFCADKENWVNDVLGMPDGYSSEVEGSSEINQDGGTKAREALEHVQTFS